MEVLVLEPWTSSLLCGGYSSVLRNDVCVCFVELEALDHVPRCGGCFGSMSCLVPVTIVNTLKGHNLITFQCPPKVCLVCSGAPQTSFPLPVSPSREFGFSSEHPLC